MQEDAFDVDTPPPSQPQGWGSWVATGVGAVSSAAYTTLAAAVPVGAAQQQQPAPPAPAPSTEALRRLVEAVDAVSVAAAPTAEPTAEAMLDLVYDLVVPSLHEALSCGLRPPAGWLPRFAGATVARRSVWELFAVLPPRVAGAAHDDGYYDSLKKTVGFVREAVAEWREEHGLEHETAIPIDGEAELRGAPHELVVLIAMGLQEGALGKWLRVVLGNASHTARHYEASAALLCDSGTAQRVIELAEALDALQLGGVADEGSGGGRRIGRTQQGLPHRGGGGAGAGADCLRSGRDNPPDPRRVRAKRPPGTTLSPPTL